VARGHARRGLEDGAAKVGLHPNSMVLPFAEEPRRFAAVVDALHAQWHHDKSSKGVAEAAEATLPWVPIVKA
jgi:hypothetical protein